MTCEPNTPEERLKKVTYVPGKSLTAYVEIPANGYYTFYKWTKRALSTSIIIDDVVVLPTARAPSYGIVGLKQGLHRIEIVADRNANEEPGDIRWSGPNRLPQPLETALLKKQAQ